MYNAPYIRPGLLERTVAATKSFNFGSFLDGIQKTLGVINQAIPIVYQVKPMLQNARTMFRIADEIRKPNESASSSDNTNNVTKVSVKTVSNENRPIFYI